MDVNKLIPGNKYTHRRTVNVMGADHEVIRRVKCLEITEDSVAFGYYGEEYSIPKDQAEREIER